MPTVLMPTRITSLSATLIDHIYYYDGYSRSSAANVYSGNILCDFISDHLPRYTLIMSKHKMSKKSKPFVRIFIRRIWKYLIIISLKLIGMQFVVLKMLILLTIALLIKFNMLTKKPFL